MFVLPLAVPPNWASCTKGPAGFVAIWTSMYSLASSPMVCQSNDSVALVSALRSAQRQAVSSPT